MPNTLKEFFFAVRI